MNKKTGSVISLLLSIILIFSVVCPMAFAADTEEKNYPVIYISGYGTNLYKEKDNSKSEMIYPLDIDLEAITITSPTLLTYCLKQSLQAII